MVLIQLLLPTILPKGPAVHDATAALADTHRELAERFDGVTAYLRSPAKDISTDQVAHGQGRPTLGEYLVCARFWFESFQNWQSEFLAIAAMVWLSVYLRQRWSPESKPVHAAHDETGR